MSVPEVSLDEWRDTTMRLVNDITEPETRAVVGALLMLIDAIEDISILLAHIRERL